MKKENIRSIIALAVLLAVFCVIAFAVPFNRTPVFWLSFAFAIAAFALQCYALPKSFSDDSPKSRFYGFPIIRIAAVYLMIQVVVSYVFMAVADKVQLWIPLIFYVVLLAIAVIGLISADVMRDEIEKMDEKLKKNVFTMRNFQSKVETIKGKIDDTDAEAKICELAENLRYSDPVSSDKLADIENELSALLDSLQQAVVDGDKEAVITLCDRTQTTLTERNRLCKLYK